MTNEGIHDYDYSDAKYDGWKQAEKDITFAGATTNGIGDFDGTGDPFDIFTVTGSCLVKVLAVCTTDLVAAASASTVSVGADVSGQYAEIIAATSAERVASGELWHDATPDKSIELATVMTEQLIVDDTDVVGECAGGNTNTGVIKFICLWKPMSKDGKVVAA